jgi:gas vesicle protein
LIDDYLKQIYTDKGINLTLLSEDNLSSSIINESYIKENTNNHTITEEQYKSHILELTECITDDTISTKEKITNAIKESIKVIEEKYNKKFKTLKK